MIKLSERVVRLTIEKFSDALQVCSDRNYNNQQVIKFFGKKRAANWCGSWNGYPDVTLAIWYEKRYGKKFYWPAHKEYFDSFRYLNRNSY